MHFTFPIYIYPLRFNMYFIYFVSMRCFVCFEVLIQFVFVFQ